MSYGFGKILDGLGMVSDGLGKVVSDGLGKVSGGFEKAQTKCFITDPYVSSITKTLKVSRRETNVTKKCCKMLWESAK